MLECISFASAAAKGPEPRRTSIFVNNYVDFFLTKPTLSSVFKSYHRPSVLGVGVYCSFYLQLCWNFFSPNRPYRPSLSQNENRPSLGGESTVIFLARYAPEYISRKTTSKNHKNCDFSYFQRWLSLVKKILYFFVHTKEYPWYMWFKWVYLIFWC